MDRNQVERELSNILMAAIAGEASTTELERLNSMILQDPTLGSFVVDLMSLDSWLSWHRKNSAKEAEGIELPDFVLQEMLEVDAISLAEDLDCCVALEEACSTQKEHLQKLPAANTRGKTFGRQIATAATAKFPYVVAATLLLTLGAALGSSISLWRLNSPPTIDSLPENTQSADSSYYGNNQLNNVARLIPQTPCLFNTATEASLAVNNSLRTGEMLKIQEGLAKLQLSWESLEAVLEVEGPAGLVLTADRGVSLSHGKLTADIRTFDNVFFLDTPAGQIEVSGEVSLGIHISGSDLSFHVFHGIATFTENWTGGRDEVQSVEVLEGTSLSVSGVRHGKTSFEHGISSRAIFATRSSMQADQLLISQDYIDQVLAKKPVLYWRFEEPESRIVRNSAGNERYTGRVVGVVGSLQNETNCSLELGSNLNLAARQTYLICDEPFDESLRENYTVETWIKPSHFHWGTIVSLIQEPRSPLENSFHGLILELGGARHKASKILQPGRIRYLHRNPPGSNAELGTSCFSNNTYRLRKWQHVVAVKDAEKMKLYVDGSVVSEETDQTELVAGLKLLVGQLDEMQGYRQFVGQIDELAVYDQPLSHEQIKLHYELTRPKAKNTNSLRAPYQDVQLEKAEANHVTPDSV